MRDTNLHDPTKAAKSNETMNHTISVAASSILRVWRSLGVQMAQAVLDLAVGNARAPVRKTAWRRTKLQNLRVGEKKNPYKCRKHQNSRRGHDSIHVHPVQPGRSSRCDCQRRSFQGWVRAVCSTWLQKVKANCLRPEQHSPGPDGCVHSFTAKRTQL